MNRNVLAVVAILAFPAAVLAADVKGFHKTYAEAVKIAKAEGKPLYLHFTTTWCGWCRRIEADTYASDIGGKALKDFVPATLDCTVRGIANPPKDVLANRALMGRLGGSGYPFLAMLRHDGALLNTVGGYVKPE